MTPSRRSLVAIATAAATALASMTCPQVVAAHADSAAPAAAAVPLSPCVSPDHGNPVLVAATVTPDVMDVRTSPGTVTVRVGVRDEGGPGAASGVAKVRAHLGFDDINLADVGGGAWQADVPVPVGVEPMNRVLTEVTIEDRAGNRTVLTEEGLRIAGVTEAVRVDSIEDRRRPKLVALHLSKSSVNARRHVRRIHVTARLTDDYTGLRDVSLFAAGRRTQSATANLHRIAGSARDGRWAGTLTVTRWQGSGRWPLTVDAADEINAMSVGHKRLARRGMPAALRVRSGSDVSDPRVRHVHTSTPSVDVRAGDGGFTVRVRASDTQSGVASVILELKQPGEIRDIDLRHVRGTARRGIWRASVPLPHCRSRQAVYTGRLFLDDRSGRFSSTGRVVSIRVRNTDIRPPQVARVLASSHTRNGPFVVDLSEAVTGLTSTSAVVRSAPFEQGDPGGLPPALRAPGRAPPRRARQPTAPPAPYVGHGGRRRSPCRSARSTRWSSTPSMCSPSPIGTATRSARSSWRPSGRRSSERPGRLASSARHRPGVIRRGERPMIFITAKFRVRPQDADRWPEIAAEFTTATRGEAGCLWFDWSRSLDDPNEYVLVEAFRDDAAGAAHVQSEHFKKAQQTLPAHLAETPRIISTNVPQDDWSQLGELAVKES